MLYFAPLLVAMAAAGSAMPPRNLARATTGASSAKPSSTSPPSSSTSAATAKSSQSHSSGLSQASSGGSSAPATTQAPTVSSGNAPTPTGSIANGRYTMPDMPNVCSDSTVPLQTSFWAQGAGVFYVEPDGGRWAGDKPFNWTFSTNTSNVYFASPEVPGASPPGTCADPGSSYCVQLNMQPRKDAQSFTLAMTAEDSMIESVMWEILPLNESDPDPSVWNTTDPKTPAGMGKGPPFYLTITGSSPCAHPVGDQNCHDNTIPRTRDAWTAFDVDTFFGNWVAKTSSKFSKNPGGSMMELFANEFGTSPGNGEICTIEGDSCNTLGSCDLLPNGGNDVQSAQVYLVWTALENMSDMFNRMWQALNMAQADATLELPSLVETFYDPGPPPSPPWYSTFSKAGSILGMFGGFMSLFPPLAPLAGVTSLTGGIVGGYPALAPDGSLAAASPPPDDLRNLTQVSTFLGNFVMGTRDGLMDSYQDIFSLGYNITDIMRGGAFVNRTDLAIDNSPAIENSINYMDQYLAIKSLNQAYWAQNVFVTYIPYGKVVQVGVTDNDGTQETTNFDESACASNFMSDGDEKTLTICHTDEWDLGSLPAGMARLTWFDPSDEDTDINSEQNGKVTLTRGAPGFDQKTKFNATGGDGWEFNVADIVKSSVQSFATKGFGYDPGNFFPQDINTPDNVHLATGMAQDIYKLKPGDTGSFSLPVCVMNNLNFWPTLFQTDKGGWAAPTLYDSYCICERTVDLNGRNFTSAVPAGLQGLMKDPSEANSDCAFSQIYGANQLPLPKMTFTW